MKRGVILLGLGAGLMYFYDPARGRRRRAHVRDQLDHTIHALDDAIQTTSRDLNNRAQGLMHEMQGRFHEEYVPDRVLEDRVRSSLGRVVSHPRAITTIAQDGHVTLRGKVLTAEMETLLDGVSSVRGVRSVANQLEMHDAPGNIPSLQGGRTRTGPNAEHSPQSWSPAARLMVGSATAAMLWSMAGRRSLIRPLLALTGAGLIARGVMLNNQQSRGMEPGSPYSDDPMSSGPGWQPAYDESYPPSPVI